MDTKLIDVLACPICKGPLKADHRHDELICAADRLAYPVRDGIPILIEGQARPLADEEPSR